MQLNKKLIRFLLVILIAGAGRFSAFAVDEPVHTAPLLGSQGNVAVNKESLVKDLEFFLPLSPIEQTIVIHNTVSAGIEQESPYIIQSDFMATIQLHVIRYNEKLQIYNESDVELLVDYKKAEGEKYNGNAHTYFEGAYQVKVIITGIKSNVNWDVSKVLRVDNTLAATRDYVFNCSADIKALNVLWDNVQGELKTSWADPHCGQTEYDLEWAWIDESAYANYLINNNPDAEKIFDNNATRISINSLTYNIPLLYDGQGRLFVRVRPVQIKYDGQRIEGLWTWQNNAIPVFYSFTGHENSLNWQASTSFAEGGKRKTVVQYFDGTLRSRQSVTKDNTTQTTVVAESFYDYQGRPVIQVLPAPTLNTAIQYAKNFNKAINYSGYPKEVYDKLNPNEGICANPAPPLDNTSGTAKYYSPNNEKINDPASPDKYIPDAEGYPFTETRFGPDGQVAAQSGVGPYHQLGTAHETKYLYEAPDQAELDALFGTDAGYAAHYFKNFVKDANGQYSVSYIDMHGRTVATALAGNTPENLDALPGVNTQNFTKQLIDEQTNVVAGKSIVSTKALAVPKAGLYKFDYTLNPDQLGLLNCNKQKICYDCLYNLTITIASDCNAENFPIVITDSNFTLNQDLNNPACNPNGKTKGFFSKNFEVQLPEGGYTITKTLSLSDSAQNIYRNVFLKNNTCKTFADFYNTEYQLLIEKSNCAITCESCKAEIGNNLDEFIQKFLDQSGMQQPLPKQLFLQLQKSYQEALKNCDYICNKDNDDGMDLIRSIRQIMLLDVTPPYGQYAKPEEANTNIFDVMGPVDNEKYRNPQPGPYTDELDEPEQENIAKLTPEQFVSQFKSSWAEQLLPYHPEYCKLKTTLDKLPDAYKFEATLNKANGWIEAKNAGYLTTVNNVINIINMDPFFSGVGNAYKNAMLAKMNVYAVVKVKEGCPPQLPSKVSMWQLAQSSVFCRNLPNEGCGDSEQNECLINTSSLPPANIMECTSDWDMVWKSFRTMYLTERKKLISQYLLAVCGTQNDVEIEKNNYQLRFIDYGNINYESMTTDDLANFFNMLNKGDKNVVDTAKKLAAQQYEETCKGYAYTWITQLQQCPQIGVLNAQDSAWLISRLVNICTLGADETHPLGSSSLKPGDPPVNDNGNLYTQFPDVIKIFLQNKGIPQDALCHPYLITAPAPYDKQAALADEPVITKPADCECERLDSLQKEFQQSGEGGTFSTYLKNHYGTNISQGAIDTLLSLCTGAYKCNFLPAPIVLPPVLQCNAPTKTCISCTDYQVLKNDFKTAFNQAAPFINPQNQEEIDWNIAFQNFANTKTGFGKSWQEYVQFEKDCGSNGQPIFLKLKMFLGGAYTDQNTLMRDDLRKLNLIPLSDPYFTDPLLITNFSPSANHIPTQVDASLFADKGNQSVVDWVWIQLHDGKDSCKILATQSGLLQRDGFVMSTGGSVQLSFFNMPDAEYYVSIRHRNHIGAMTKKPVWISNGNIASIDFTDVNMETWGTDAEQVLPNNKKALWHGNANVNKLVSFNGNFNDKDYLLNTCLNGNSNAAINNIYSTCDINMNGNIRFNGFNNDKDALLNALGNDPLAVRVQQIPSCASIYTDNFQANCDELKQLLADYYNSKFNIYHDQDNVEKGIFTLHNNYTVKDWSKFSLKDFIKDGYFGPLPDTVTTGRDFAFRYNLPMCVGNVVTFETRMRLQDPDKPVNPGGEVFIMLNTDKGTLAPVFNDAYSQNSGFVYPKYKLGIKTMIHKFNQWDTVKVVMKSDTGFVYINNQQVGYYDLDPDMNFSKLNSYVFNFTRDFLIDWVKIYDANNQVQYQEDFNDYSNFSKVPYAFACNTINCKTGAAFATFFNKQTGTNYTYDQIVKLYKNQCGIYFEPCNKTPDPLLCGLNEPVFKPVPYDPDPCKDLPKMAYTAAEEKWQLYQDSLNNVFDTAYYNKCMKAKEMESLTVNYANSEYHYTLYYYDQAGNLVKTIPPAGVKPDFSENFTSAVKLARQNNQLKVPAHTLATNYRYNTLNQVIAQQTPDAGQTNFFFDKLGRLVASQNAQQKINNKYSYTVYDALGRITEVGQKPQAAGSMNQTVSQNVTALNNWLNVNGGVKEQITNTFYDQGYEPFMIPNSPITQSNLRNRLSYSTVKNLATDALHYTATFYDYDPHGNTQTVLQDFNFGQMKSTGNRFKKITYNYDLISGKVNAVHYQPGEQDEFYHKYFYDAENRLTDVYTSRDSLTWERDSRLSYYKHGPLARNIIGQNQVQGMDYAYTLQGWLKGVNSTSVGDGKFDMGQDGINNSTVARDAFGFALHYYSTADTKDYNPISVNAKPFANAAAAGFGFVSLYNGNIAAMSINIPKLGDALLSTYRVDQLNRLIKVNSYKGLNPVTNNWNVVSTDDYREELTYDPNGNIQTYKRNGTTANNNPLAMDNMNYNYYAGTNKLNHIKDAVAKDNYSEDVDEQKTGNYKYDAIGNLISDSAEDTKNISWNVYGKMLSIDKKNGDKINYGYDAAGNRISETFNNEKSFYVRDASGNTMSTYVINDTINNGNLTQSDVDLYGSSRLGIDELNMDVHIPAKATNESRAKKKGYKKFELTDHRGNVLAVVGEHKTQHDDNNDGIVDHYSAQVLHANDSYSFGLEKPSRNYSIGGNYHYSYNGKKDDKKAGRGYQNYGWREYDKLTGRFISVDPLTKAFTDLTPYQFASNRPVDGTDLDGLEYNNTSTYVYHPPVLKNIADNTALFIPRKEQEIMMSNGLGTTYIGPRSVVESNVAISRRNYFDAVGDNIRNGVGGAAGYMLKGDQGSFYGAAVDGIAFSFAGVNGRSSVLSRPQNPTIEPALTATEVEPVNQKPIALTINLKQSWNTEQISEAYEKAHLITTEGINTKVNRSNTATRPPNLKKKFIESGGTLKTNQDVDHTQDLILNGNSGSDGKTNLSGRDKSVNRSFGKQFEIQTRNVQDNTRVSGVYINPFGKLKK